MLDDIGSWLSSIAWPLVSRVFASMGLGTVTYVGASSALGSALSAAKTAVTGLSGEVLQIMAMTGFFDAMAITAGGLIGALSWMVLKHFALQSGT